MKKVFALIMIVMSVFTISACDSSNENEPWKEIGTTKKEYMDAYNYFRYGK